MITTRLNEDGNHGEGKFSVNGMKFEVRRSTEADWNNIFALLNGEAIANTIYQLAPDLNEYLRNNDPKDVKAEDIMRILMGAYGSNVSDDDEYLQEAVSTPDKSSNKMRIQEPFIDYENPVEIYKRIKTGLSFVTMAQNGAHSEIAGHMWAVDLSEADMPGIIEITAGVVAPDYRDAGKHTAERLNIQNRNRFALLNEVASRYPDETRIVSISRQSLVARPLEASGFIELSPESAGEILTEAVWYPPWIARCTTVGQWKALVEEKEIDTPEKYNQFISDYIKRRKKESKMAADMTLRATGMSGGTQLLRKNAHTAD